MIYLDTLKSNERDTVRGRAQSPQYLLPCLQQSSFKAYTPQSYEYDTMEDLPCCIDQVSTFHTTTYPGPRAP
jgi:hypothetical protein